MSPEKWRVEKMSRFTRPYVGASVVRSCSGVVPEGPEKGKRFVLTLREGFKSHGYRSDYQRIPCRWLTWELDGRHWFTWSFTGRRYEAASAAYTANLAELSAACAKASAEPVAVLS
jgi:hypothetical protein